MTDLIRLSQNDYQLCISSLFYVMIEDKRRGNLSKTKAELLYRLFNTYRNEFGMDDFYQKIDTLMEKVMPEL